MNPTVPTVTVDHPLLTIAIPTYRRSALLEELLSVLAPQLEGRTEVELIISDNSSPDDTPRVVQRFIDAGMPIHYHHRHRDNIGPDANFSSCFHMARGKYFWLFADDDIIVPGTLDELIGHIAHNEYDLIYATNYGFQTDWRKERQEDPFHRRFHNLSDARCVAKVVNIMFTFISGMIVNKQRLQEIPHEDPSAFLDTNLIQLSWALPLLRNHRRSLILWGRPVAARQGNAGGYSIGNVFGQKLSGVLASCLPDHPELAGCIIGFALRRWFPSIIHDIRAAGNQNLQLDQAHAALTRAYGKNFRYWLFTYPALKLPLPLGQLWVRAGAILSKIIYMISIPDFWRKEI